MHMYEDQYRLLRSVFDVSNALLQSASESDLDRVDELLCEQQRLIEMAVSRKKAIEAGVRSVKGGHNFNRRISLLTAGIEENIKRLVSILQGKKKDRFQSIKEVQKHRSLSTYIR